jgi:hypothetical protein
MPGFDPVQNLKHWGNQSLWLSWLKGVQRNLSPFEHGGERSWAGAAMA